MSIAKTAPEKFRFQDLVCADLLLRFYDSPGFAIYIEPHDGEDAQIELAMNGRRLSVEVQVKGSRGDFTTARLAECLAHFPPRTVRNCLLERLLSDPNRFVLLVVSARSDDSAAPYVVEFDRAMRLLVPEHIITRKHAKALLAELARLGLKSSRPTKLQTARLKYCKRLASEIQSDVLRDAAQRLFLIDRVSAETLETNCHNRLRADHLVPGDRSGDALRDILDAVRKAKNEGIDARPLARRVVEHFRQRSLRPEYYAERGDEEHWTAELSVQNVLLLSGPPRCGKSISSRWVASTFQMHGYDVREGNDPDAGSRFLLDPSKGPRLFLLDDPLGGGSR